MFHSLFSLRQLESILLPINSVIRKLLKMQNSRWCHLIASRDVDNLHRPSATISEIAKGNLCIVL